MLFLYVHIKLYVYNMDPRWVNRDVGEPLPPRFALTPCDSVLRHVHPVGSTFDAQHPSTCVDGGRDVRRSAALVEPENKTFTYGRSQGSSAAWLSEVHSI